MARNSGVAYVEVAPCAPLGKRGRDTYTYFVFKDDDVGIGSVVKIPFGKRMIMGVVTVLDVQKPSYPTKQISSITGVALTALQIRYAQWIADMAHGGFGFTARLFLPPSFAKLKSHAQLRPPSPPPSPRIGRGKATAIIEKNPDTRRNMIATLVRVRTGQTLVLVPEVAMLDGYKKTFAVEIKNNTARVYHAGLSQSEKKEIWSAADSGQCQIIIGTQKVLFLPFNNLVCVIVDEEQNESYKLWDQYPRLYTVLGAETLAHLAGASLVYGSSHPSLRLLHAIAEKKCEALRNNPVSAHVEIYPFSFEDKKWKRIMPDELGSKVRMWARARKHVLLLFNKKDTAELKKSLFRKMSVSAKEHIYIGTMGILTNPPRKQFDYAVWLKPEWTLRAIDYRSAERARITVARMAGLTASHDVFLGTRYGDVAKDVFALSEEVWREKTYEERRRFHLPPYWQLVRLTIRDKTRAKAYARAESVRGMIDVLLDAKKSNTVAYGPYQELGAKKKEVHEYHILLSGILEELIPLYKELPIDSADVAPYRVV